jgi:Sulfotransferase domain
MRPLRILFIVGPTRSGSTLLSRVLNEFRGVESIGEGISLDLAFQSSRVQGLARGAAKSTLAPHDARRDASRRFSGLCGCGEALPDCPVWGRIEASVFGDPPDYTHWDWDAARPSVTQLLAGGARGWLEQQPAERGRFAESVYRELADVTHAQIIVDDSKSPLYCYFLAQQPWAEVVPVRLIRDPRATAASWSHLKRYPGIASGGLPAHPAAHAVVAWLKRVLLADHLFDGCGPVLRYEDFVADPIRNARRLLDFFGEAAEAPVGDGTARTLTFGTNHIVAGNPDKFERGRIEIRPPSDPAQALGPGARAIVTAATLPMLYRYGYRVWR